MNAPQEPGAERSSGAPPWATYALMQVPDLLLVGSLLVLGWRIQWLSTTEMVMAMLLWVAKDALLYRFVAPVLSRHPMLGPERLIGKRAMVVRDLDPEGTVRLDGELWRAISLDGPICRGRSVAVRQIEGLTLHVVARSAP